MDKQKDGRRVRPKHCGLVMLAGFAIVIWSGIEAKTGATGMTYLGLFGGIAVILIGIGVLVWITMPSNNPESIE